MIIKSNTTMQTNSVKISDLSTLLSGLDLPEGSQLVSISKNPVTPDINGNVPEPTYTLYFEWEMEV